MLNLILTVLIAGAAVLLDRWTKALAVEHLMGQAARPLIPGIINLTYTENTGAAFGMMKGYRWFFITLSCAAIIAMLVYVIWKRNKLNPMLTVALSMIIGGGIGNQIDRFVDGYVVDFLDFAFMNFAVFNVADTFVTVGAALLILYILIFERAAFTDKPKNGAAAATSDGKVIKEIAAEPALGSEKQDNEAGDGADEAAGGESNDATGKAGGKPESGAPGEK